MGIDTLSSRCTIVPAILPMGIQVGKGDGMVNAEELELMVAAGGGIDPDGRKYFRSEKGKKIYERPVWLVPAIYGVCIVVGVIIGYNFTVDANAVSGFFFGMLAIIPARILAANFVGDRKVYKSGMEKVAHEAAIREDQRRLRAARGTRQSTDAPLADQATATSDDLDKAGMLDRSQ